MRSRLFEIIEKSNGDRASAIYDYTMMAVIIASLTPLAFKHTTPALIAMDRVTVVIFILDYLLRHHHRRVHGPHPGGAAAARKTAGVRGKVTPRRVSVAAL